MMNSEIVIRTQSEQILRLQNDMMSLEQYIKDLEQQNTRLNELNHELEQKKERDTISINVMEVLIKLKDNFKDLELLIGELR